MHRGTGAIMKNLMIPQRSTSSTLYSVQSLSKEEGGEKAINIFSIQLKDHWYRKSIVVNTERVYKLLRQY